MLLHANRLRQAPAKIRKPGPYSAPSGPITIVFDGSSVTASSLLNNLVNQFVTDPGVARSLLAKLEAAQASAARGDINSMDGQLGAFINEVSAQSGKTLTAAQANILIQVATAEMK